VICLLTKALQHLNSNNMKPDEVTNQSNPAQEKAQRQKEQDEQRRKNWRPWSKKEIYLLEKIGMRLRVTKPDSESGNQNQ
jgi:hypothetical protein